MTSAATDPAGALPRILTRSSEDLLRQVGWFNRLRLFVVVAMLVLITLGVALEVIADPRPLYVLTGVTLLVDVGYMWWFRRLSRVSALWVRRHVDLQIAIDLVILTAMLHYSGGITNPAALFYLFHAFIAALLLSVRAALVVVLVASCLAGGLAFAERFGVLPHHPLSIGLIDLPRATVLGLAVWVLAFAATLALSVYFVATVLAQLVDREKQLARLDRQLSQSEKLASVGNLAAGVAHEINNPVAVIQNKVQILRYRIADEEPGEVLQEDLDTVEKHVGRIRSITDGLLTFSREAPFALVELDLDAVVREGVELVKVPFDAAGVELEMRLLTPGQRVRGSQNHLLQVLVNVLLNAVDAASAGSRVTVETQARDGVAAIRIEDRGAGIDPAHLSKIFDPFFTTKDVGRGTGLGLAISHGIVERHGGRIEVDSELGRGSIFVVWLPLAVSGGGADSG